MNCKFIIPVVVLLVSINAFSQNVNTPISAAAQTKSLNGSDNNELRINLLMAVAGMPELNYERYIADNMGVGLSLAVTLDNVDNESIRSIILPYYRVYFGSKKANGFFIEGNMAVAGVKEYNTVYYSSYYSSMYAYEITPPSYKYSTNVGFGAAFGAKFLTRNNFIGEAYLGIGRLYGESTTKAYPRVGISLGKRF